MDPAPKPDGDFSNVDFLGQSLHDPLNVLRSKLKELSSLPEEAEVRRVFIVSELVIGDHRTYDVIWSEGREEPQYIVQDSLVAMLARISSVLLEGPED